MKNILFFVLICAVVSCRGTSESDQKAVSNSGTSSVQPVAKKKTILFFGDSLTAAYGLSKEEGFPALVQQKLDSLGLPYQCVNAGLSGETTDEGLERVEWVLEQPVDVFVLELGANDAFRGREVADIRANLQAIIDKVLNKYPDCSIVLAGMLAPPNLGSQYTTAFAGIFPALAKQNDIALIPFLLEGVAAQKSLNQQDGIHPTAEGQKIVAENVWKVLRLIVAE
jgi:acyl-CoA thioesterase-1